MPMNREKYPPDWEKRVEKIRERSGNKCEKCGRLNGQVVYSAPVRYLDDSDGYYKVRYDWFDYYNDAAAETINVHLIRPVKVVLTTAHLDHDESNWDVKDDRLMHLCQLHHLRLDSEEKSKRRKEKIPSSD